MDGRPRKPTPIIRSSTALRAIMAGITLTTFTGISAFAATHIQNPAAPLKPSADSSQTQATPTPAPTARNRFTTTGRVPTTGVAPRTRTSSS